MHGAIRVDRATDGRGSVGARVALERALRKGACRIGTRAGMAAGLAPRPRAPPATRAKRRERGRTRCGAGRDGIDIRSELTRAGASPVPIGASRSRWHLRALARKSFARGSFLVRSSAKGRGREGHLGTPPAATPSRRITEWPGFDARPLPPPHPCP
jgi:hypothetical protein